MWCRRSATVFVSSKRALPFLTVAMLAISDFVRQWGWLMLLALIGGGIAPVGLPCAGRPSANASMPRC